MLSACEEAGTNHEAFYREMRINNTLREYYARARECRADTRFESVDQITNELRSGLIDHNQARVMIDAIKWQTGKEKPKIYGDSITHKGDASAPLSITLATGVPKPDDAS